MRKLGFIVTVVMLVGALAIPVYATKPDQESGLEVGHKITICHATRSLSNPYVIITIDVAAWDEDDPDKDDHGLHHSRTKVDRDGTEYTWHDAPLVNGKCPSPKPITDGDGDGGGNL